MKLTKIRGSRMTPEELEKFRQLLLLLREELASISGARDQVRLFMT
ncbi:MAG: hypothetical protein ABR522_06675 [Marinobacter sp.]